MFYMNYKKHTWITKDNEPYFLTNIDDEEIHLSLYGLYQHYFTPDNFPTDFEPLKLPKFNIGDKSHQRHLNVQLLQSLKSMKMTSWKSILSEVMKIIYRG